MKTKEAIARRRSCRAFKPYQISNRELDIVLQGGNAAPVGTGNYEAVHITVIQNGELLRKLDLEGAKSAGNPSIHPLYGAPTLIVISGADGDAHQREISECNSASIIENMMVTAADIGLGSCYIMGMIVPLRDNKGLCGEIKIPDGFFPCAGVALGYPAEEPEMRELVTDKIATEYVR